jgi:hypothetical protein
LTGLISLSRSYPAAGSFVNVKTESGGEYHEAHHDHRDGFELVNDGTMAVPVEIDDDSIGADRVYSLAWTTEM